MFVEVLSNPSLGCFVTHCLVEFNLGELGFWGSSCGISLVYRPINKRKASRRHVENGCTRDREEE
uniref:Uncharacterized protein n=1 Tax=Vitis vinifera TaxID=29760 RepID=F6I4D4_VITVI